MSETEPTIDKIERSSREKARTILDQLSQLTEPQSETEEERSENFKKALQTIKKNYDDEVQIFFRKNAQTADGFNANTGIKTELKFAEEKNKRI